MSDTTPATPQSQFCPNSLIFVRDVLSNPAYLAMSPTEIVKKFNENSQNFKFDEQNQQLWSFLVIKAFEEKSNLRSLASTLVNQELVSVSADMAKVAGHHLFIFTRTMEPVKDIENQLNGFMEEFHHFDEKIVITNAPIQEHMNWCSLVLQKSSLDDLKEARSFLAGILKFKDVLAPFIEAKEAQNTEGNKPRKAKP